MFCKWHGLEVDPEGFLRDREERVADDLTSRAVSFESSALLSHSIAELAERFDARFVLLVRNPHDTVASFAARGWFLDPIPWANPGHPPTLPDAMEPRHFFGRNLPRGAEFERWRNLSQIGRLAWFWAARNTAILEQLTALPPSRRTLLRLEDFDYDRYCSVAHQLGWSVTASRDAFEELAAKRPNAGPNAPVLPATWDEQSTHEFETEVGALARALGYEVSTEHRRKGAPSVTRDAYPIDDAYEAVRCASLFPPEGTRTWHLRRDRDDHLAEVTWADDALEIWTGTARLRERFLHPRDLRVAVEDWLEDFALQGYRQAAPRPAIAESPAPIRYREIAAQIRAEFSSPGAWLTEKRRITTRDALDEDDVDHYDYYDEPNDPLEEVPEYVLRSAASLALDEAFDERIKEGPFDLDPLHERPSVIEPPLLPHPQCAHLDVHLDVVGGAKETSAST